MQFSPEWMDIACIKGTWDVIISEDADHELEGILVYHMRKYKGFTLILMPPQTFYNGIYLNYKDKPKTHSKISFENNVVNKLLAQLPSHDLYYQQYAPQITNNMPQIWAGYNTSTRYTYLIDIQNKSEEELWSQLKTKTRNKIRKAINLTKIISIDFNSFWAHCEKAFAIKGKAVPFNKTILSKAYDTFHKKGTCEIRASVDVESNKILAATLMTKDTYSTYYVAGYYLSEKKDSGALSYLLWDSIKNCDTPIFDFEGSMIKSVEYFFRAFGGQLTPHYKVWKINSPLLKFITKFKKLPFLDW